MSSLAVSHSLAYRVAHHTVSSKDNIQTWYVRQPHTLILWAEVFFPQVKILKDLDFVFHSIFDRMFSLPKLYETVHNFTSGFNNTSTAKKAHLIADRTLLISDCVKNIFRLGKTLLPNGTVRKVLSSCLPVLSILGAVFLLYHNGSKIILSSKKFLEKHQITQEDKNYYLATMGVYISKFAMGVLSCISLYYGGNYFYSFLYVKTAIGIFVTNADILKVKYAKE